MLSAKCLMRQSKQNEFRSGCIKCNISCSAKGQKCASVFALINFFWNPDWHSNEVFSVIILSNFIDSFAFFSQNFINFFWRFALYKFSLFSLSSFALYMWFWKWWRCWKVYCYWARDTLLKIIIKECC